VLDEGDQRFLWGGESETMRFDVTDCILESLWWPPTGEAVAGPLLGVPLNLLEKEHWKQTSWAQIQSQHPEALVLDKGQAFERPKSWPRYPVPEDLDALRQAKAEIAPKWGENQ
ncbi:MAG: DUF3179 domain-containing protein, partial [Verrucomicrobia bacterium]|nr:DUF3179 domain-containing protein [Verrucomicrobiota bacterium]